MVATRDDCEWFSFNTANRLDPCGQAMKRFELMTTNEVPYKAERLLFGNTVSCMRYGPPVIDILFCR